MATTGPPIAGLDGWRGSRDGFAASFLVRADKEACDDAEWAVSHTILVGGICFTREPPTVGESPLGSFG